MRLAPRSVAQFLVCHHHNRRGGVDRLDHRRVGPRAIQHDIAIGGRRELHQAADAHGVDRTLDGTVRRAEQIGTGLGRRDQALEDRSRRADAMFSIASSTEKRGSTPKNTEASPCARCKSISSVDSPDRPRAPSPGSPRRSCCRRHPWRQARRWSGPSSAWRRRAPRGAAPDRASSSLSGSATHSLTPMRIASSIAVGLERLGDNHDAGGRKLALRPAPISRGRRDSPRTSNTNASGPFDPADERSRGRRGPRDAARKPRSRNPAGGRDRPSPRGSRRSARRLPHQRDADDERRSRA